jgi:hypothetical protein
MWLNQDSLARSLIYATSTPEVPSTYIHPFPSPEPPKNILLLIRERITKNISIFPCKINAQVILLLPLAILSHEMSALIKTKKEKKIRGNKKGQVPGTSKEKKVRREVKMDKCPIVELGVQDTHLRGKKKKI